MGTLAVAGCSSSDGPGIGEGPTARIVSSVIACKAESDCQSGETCGDGYCQMRRCTDKYTSIAPAGKTGYAYIDRAIVASAASSTLDVYSAHAKGSALPAAATPVDIAGGNFTGSRPEGFAYISGGSTKVNVVAGGKTTSLDAGFVGAHLASGDIDGDGLDELVVVGAGKYAVCSAVTGKCSAGTVSGTQDDVALGDLDGDGLDEILFIGNHVLTIVDTNAKKVSTQPIVPTLAHITAGDLDGDGKDELIGTEIGNIIGDDKIHLFAMLSDSLAKQAEFSMDFVNSSGLDLVFTKQDDKPILAVLASANEIRTFTYANGAITQAGSTPLLHANSAHLAASDVAGRSPSVKLKGDPTLVRGPVVPLSVLTSPPYSAAHSAGVSNVNLGMSEGTNTNESSTESHASTVSLSVGGGVSAHIATFGANFNVNVGRTMTRGWARGRGAGSGMTIGQSWSIDARPEVRGYQTGAVVLAGACFHKYEYSVEDPAKLLGNGGDSFTTWVPVGGETTLWSTERYNALVDAMADGRLPKIQIQPKLGDVASYPTSPTTLDGKPIPDADNVFPHPPSIHSPDVAAAGFSLTSVKVDVNVTSTSFGMGQSVTFSEGAHNDFGFKVFGIGAGVDVSVSASEGSEESSGLDKTYAVAVAKATTFGGSIQPVPDLPQTPEDESALYGYSFKPYVYRHHYKEKDGTEGAFYAITYTVGQ